MGPFQQREAIKSNQESCKGLVKTFRRQRTGKDKTKKKKRYWPLNSENNIQLVTRKEMQNAGGFFLPIQITKIVLMMAPNVLKGVRKQVSTLKNHWGIVNYDRLLGHFYQKPETVYSL